MNLFEDSFETMKQEKMRYKYKEVPVKMYVKNLQREMYHCEEHGCVNNSICNSNKPQTDEAYKNSICLLKQPKLYIFGSRWTCEDMFLWEE